MPLDTEPARKKMAFGAELSYAPPKKKVRFKNGKTKRAHKKGTDAATRNMKAQLSSQARTRRRQPILTRQRAEGMAA
jgi:hypothetical protein